MKPVLLERLSENKYRIHIWETLLDKIECGWSIDFFNIEVLGEPLCDTWGDSSILYADYRHQLQVFNDVEQAKEFARMVRKMVLAYTDKSLSEAKSDTGLIEF